MKSWFLAFLMICAPVVAAPAAKLNRLTRAEKRMGWHLLFDGKSAAEFRGYKLDRVPASWVVKDGALVLEKGGGGDLITRQQYESFELSVEWRISPGGNSGIMFKVLETDGPSYSTGPEAQVQDNVAGHDPQKAGWMYALYPASVDTTKPAGEWNQFVLKCQKTPAGTYKCEHHMNGTKYVAYEIGSDEWNQKVAKTKFASMPGFGKAARGHICLQDHGNVVAYLNIKIRELK